MQGAENILQVVQLYNGSTWFFPLFLLAAAFVLAKLSRENRRNALLMAASAILIVFNDLVFRLVGRVENVQTYYRFLWMIPVIPTLAYAALDLLIRQKTVLRRCLAAAAMVFVILLAGDSYLKAKGFTAPQKVQYLNGETADVCNIISADKTVERPIVASDFSLVQSLRLYDPTIKNALLRKTYTSLGEVSGSGSAKRQRRIYRLVNGKEVIPAKVRQALEKNGVSYVVIATEYQRDELMEEMGCSVVGRTASYTVYRTGY